MVLRDRDMDIGDAKKFLKFLFYFYNQRFLYSGTNIDIIHISIYTSSLWDLPPFRGLKLLSKFHCDCIPIRICSIHPIMSSLRFAIQEPVMSVLLSGREALKLRRRLHTYVPNKQQTLLNELSEYGLRSENLPKSIGGSYGDDENPAWVHDIINSIQKSNISRKRGRDSLTE